MKCTATIQEKIIFNYILLMLVALLPVETFAKVYTCKKDGYITYQDTPCKRVIKKQKGMRTFDDWSLGTSIEEMKKIARSKRLPMRPKSVSYVSGYNRKIINSRPADRTYIYDTELLGKHSRVNLHFTKKTKQLYQINVQVNVVTAKREERKYLYEKLFNQLCEKYGKPKVTDTDLIKETLKKSPTGYLTKQFAKVMTGELLLWTSYPGNTVDLNYKKRYESINTYKLRYTNTKLKIQNKRESTKEMKSKTDRAVNIDSTRL